MYARKYTEIRSILVQTLTKSFVWFSQLFEEYLLYKLVVKFVVVFLRSVENKRKGNEG